MELLVVLLILLAVTRVLGEVAVRIGQPALLGELLGGILLGLVLQFTPAGFPHVQNLGENEVFVAITDLGVFFLMLLAGIEMRPRELTERSGRAIPVAVGGMLVPLALGMGLGWAVIPPSEYRVAQVLFLGTALAITAVPVAVKILLDLDRLESRAGKTIVAAALVDDVLSLVLLAVLTAVLRTGSLPSLADAGILVGKIVLFFAITAAVGRYLVARYFQPLVERIMGEEFEFSLLLVMALAFAVLAEQMGMHFIIGTFVAGLFFHDQHTSREVFERVQAKIGAITKGFLAPIFFASIGIRMEVEAVAAVPGFVALLIVVALAGKVLGAGVPALWGGLSRREAATVGIGMSARGAVELIIAGVALEAGLFSRPDPTPEVVANLFSAVVVMAVVTTLLTPIGLRLLLDDDQREADTQASPEDRAAPS